MTIITLKATCYSGGISYVPVSLDDKYLMQHCLNTDFASINHNRLEKLKVMAKAHDWNIVIV